MYRHSPSFRVVSAVADADDEDLVDLEPPLSEVVDPTALDRLFEATATSDRSGEGRVTFRYRGHDVIVRSDGDVELE
ncbi:HalOD1 output domain-containing protein [Natrarchaeobaculum aegyptiacum]|uniref:Halobacterial output domain-containing protein n=1 Tax=Natrarchaeobaculum aegyptiacum TaxID=745377 RepID=A0A2Z2HV39_9EURY|nr:HalOD1 output domain-containing protein [Natrarchaeobaculum aegyptiacum]ARS91061.1 hypothetical protein B1756_15860 [Natrarchaeobaculum aegyptiacum]